MLHQDYTTITELPDSLLTPEQMQRFAHRYGVAYELVNDKRVLEVACGAGSALSYLSQRAASIIGLDYTWSVLRHAQKHARAPLVQGNAQHLPFAGEEFDVLLCFEAIYYLPNYRHFLNECHRLLAPRGKLLICQSNPDWPNFAPGALTTHYPSLPELAAELARAGFQQVRAHGTLPIDETSPRQQRINALRRWVMQSGMLSRLGPIKPLLQRLSYGKLHPLPSSIHAQWVATWQERLKLKPLSLLQTDRVHRVIYLEGTKLALLCTFYDLVPAW